MTYEQITIFDYLRQTGDLEEVMLGGSQFRGGKLRIYALYQVEQDKRKRAKWLSDEYGTGGRTTIFSDGRRGFADFSPKGVEVWFFDSDARTLYRWAEAEECVKKLIESGMYLSMSEMDEWERLGIDPDNIPYPMPAYRFPPVGTDDGGEQE